MNPSHPPSPGSLEPMSCDLARALALEERGGLAADELHAQVKAHIESCPDCLRAMPDLVRCKAMLAAALSTARGNSSGPSAERIDAILAGLADRPPAAELLARTRRTVRRLLWVTLLLLSLLLIWLVAWGLRMLLGRSG